MKEKEKFKKKFWSDKEDFDITDTYTNVKNLIKENEGKLNKLSIEHVKNHKYVDAYDLNNVKNSEYKGDTNKLFSGKYEIHPRYNTKDNIPYVQQIGYTPSFQEFYKNGY